MIDKTSRKRTQLLYNLRHLQLWISNKSQVEKPSHYHGKKASVCTSCDLCQLSGFVIGFGLWLQLLPGNSWERECRRWVGKTLYSILFMQSNWHYLKLVILPRGDIEVQVGDNALTLYCRLNPSYRYFKDYGLNARNLKFVMNNEDGSNKMESTILNETTISTTYNPSKIRTDQINCEIDIDGTFRGICMSAIHVGGTF